MTDSAPAGISVAISTIQTSKIRQIRNRRVNTICLSVLTVPTPQQPPPALQAAG